MSVDLSSLDDLAAGQDRGAEMTIKHPVTNEDVGSLTVVGPDSDTARRSRLAFQDELLEVENRPSATEMERMEISRLARLVISWTLTRDGTAVPFTHTNVVKLLREQESVRQQLRAFSESRAPYFMRLPVDKV